VVERKRWMRTHRCLPTNHSSSQAMHKKQMTCVNCFQLFFRLDWALLFMCTCVISLSFVRSNGQIYGFFFFLFVPIGSSPRRSTILFALTDRFYFRIVTT